MTTLPFGDTLRLWRQARGFTQAELAQRARIARPNLSAMEQGQREPALRTVLALAVALDVKAGTLVDGVAPPAPHLPAPPLSRGAMERIAEAVAQGRAARDAREQALVVLVQRMVRYRGGAMRRRWHRWSRSRRAGERAWMLLESSYPKETIENLVQRIADRQLVRVK